MQNNNIHPGLLGVQWSGECFTTYYVSICIIYYHIRAIPLTGNKWTAAI